MAMRRRVGSEMAADPLALALGELDYTAQPDDPKRLHLSERETKRHAQIVKDHGAAVGDLWLEGLKLGRAESSGHALNAAREMGRIIKLFDLTSVEIRALVGELSTKEMAAVQAALQTMKEGVWK